MTKKTNLITDVAIDELSLVFANKDGKAYRPVNPEAVVLATKSEEHPAENTQSRKTLLGEFAQQLSQKSEDIEDAQLSVAYTAILNTLFIAVDDIFEIRFAPDSFTSEMKKSALKTVVDNFVKAVGSVIPAVLKAQIDNRVNAVARPPSQALPGDHPANPQPESEAAITQPPVPIEPPGPPQSEGDDLKAQLAQVETTLTSQKAEIETLKFELDKAKSEAIAAKDQIKALVEKAHEPTPNATASREVQTSKKSDSDTVLNGKPPNLPSTSGNGMLEAAILAQLNGKAS